MRFIKLKYMKFLFKWFTSNFEEQREKRNCEGWSANNMISCDLSFLDRIIINQNDTLKRAIFKDHAQAKLFKAIYKKIKSQANLVFFLKL